MKTKPRLASPDKIEDAIEKLSSRYFSRLINVCDIIMRYTNIVYKDRIDWLKLTSLIAIVYIGKGSMMPKVLAGHLLRLNQSITKLIYALEKDGYIIREPIEDDRRSINLRVTSAGLSYVMNCLKDIDIADEMLRSSLTESEMEIFFTLTRKVRKGAIQEVIKKVGKRAKTKKR